MPIILEETDNRDTPLAEYPTSFGDYMGAKFDEAYAQNPLTLGDEAYRLHEAQSQGKMLSAEDARKQANDAGVKLSIPEDGISDQALGILIKNQQDNAKHQLIINGSPTGARSFAGFSAEVFASMLDPMLIVVFIFVGLFSKNKTACLYFSLVVGGVILILSKCFVERPIHSLDSNYPILVGIIIGCFVVFFAKKLLTGHKQ